MLTNTIERVASKFKENYMSLTAESTEVTPAPPTSDSLEPANLLKNVLGTISKITIAAITLITEIAVVAFIGSQVGLYYQAKTIQADCGRVNLAKVGDQYMQCTIVEPKKDLPTAIPR
jgi:hypothetical protein